MSSQHLAFIFFPFSNSWLDNCLMHKLIAKKKMCSDRCTLHKLSKIWMKITFQFSILTKQSKWVMHAILYCNYHVKIRWTANISNRNFHLVAINDSTYKRPKSHFTADQLMIVEFSLIRTYVVYLCDTFRCMYLVLCIVNFHPTPSSMCTYVIIIVYHNNLRVIRTSYTLKYAIK